MSGTGEGLFPVVPARPMDSAPRDGRILRLLVYYAEEGSENPLEDAHQAWTIGSNGFDNDGVDEWALAGWSWSHDCFTSGRGKVLGWLPFHGEDAPVTDDPAPASELNYATAAEIDGGHVHTMTIVPARMSNTATNLHALERFVVEIAVDAEMDRRFPSGMVSRDWDEVRLEV